MKSNVIAAALIGLILGILVEFFFAYADRVALFSCLFSPVALIFGLGLPILIGAMAAAFSRSSGLMTTPTAMVDGALAALLAEFASRLVGLCASLAATRGFFFGPRFLLPSVEPTARAITFGVWEIGWFVVSLFVAILLGALGGLLYRVMVK